MVVAFGLPCLVPFRSSHGLSPMGRGRRSGTRLRRYPSQIQLYVRPETGFCPSVALSSGPSRSRGHGRPRRPPDPCPFGFLPRGFLPCGPLRANPCAASRQACSCCVSCTFSPSGSSRAAKCSSDRTASVK